MDVNDENLTINSFNDNNGDDKAITEKAYFEGAGGGGVRFNALRF